MCVSGGTEGGAGDGGDGGDAGTEVASGVWRAARV